MKRFWFGAGLLLFLLVAGLWLGDTMTEVTSPVEADLDKAAVAALEENWPLASALYLRAERHWDAYRNLTAILIHHDPIGQIDAAFAVLPSYAATGDITGFCSTCSELAQQIRSLPYSHGVTWWNLL